MAALQLDDFSSLAYLADASVTCSELEAQKAKGGTAEEEVMQDGTSKNVYISREANVQPETDEKVSAAEDAALQAVVAEEREEGTQPNELDKAEISASAVKSEAPISESSQAPQEDSEISGGSGCRDCLSLSLKDLAQHIISKHKGPNGFTCDFCRTLFVSSVSFGKHILGHVIDASGTSEQENEDSDDVLEDGRKAEKDDDGTYHCSTCDKRFSSYLDLQRHLSLHKSYVCAVCDKGFSRPVVFKKHMLIHSREEVRMCEAERDQLYEEIKAAAAETKLTVLDAHVNKDTSTAVDVLPVCDAEPVSKRKKRKGAAPKCDGELIATLPDTTESAGAPSSKKSGTKRSADAKASEPPNGSKRRRGKMSKENKESDSSPTKTTEHVGEVKEDKEGKRLVKDSRDVNVTEGIAANNEEVRADGEGEGHAGLDGEKTSELKGEILTLSKEGVNALMEGIPTAAVEAEGHGESGSVILVTSAFGSEDEGELHGEQAGIKSGIDIKSEASYKIIITKERDKGKRPGVKRSSSYKCSQCPAEFKSRLEARDHERHMHNAVLPWQCDTCGEGFWSSSQFKKHSLIEHNDNTPFKCEHCGKKLSGPGILRTHLGIHTGIRPYACHICSRDFLTRTNLQDHLIKHANPRGYCCHLCPSKFNLRTDLSSHIRTVHENIRPWKCEHCDYAFPRQSALLRHMRTHTGEKPHKCEFCGKTFARVENCMEHRRIHTGERPHVCEVCGKTFKDSGNFSNHRKIHKDGYVPRRKKKAASKVGDDLDRIGEVPSPGKVGRAKTGKEEGLDANKTYGVVGADGKVVGTAFETIGSAVAALGSDGRVAFESLGSAVAALIGNSLPVSSAQGSATNEASAATLNNAEVEAAISGALVTENEAQAPTVTVGADNIALTTYPTGVVQGATVPTATLHDIVNAATMSATMVSNVPAQSETEVQEAMAHSNTFLQIGNFLFSLDVDNGLKTLNQVGNMSEFLTLSLAGAQVEADGQTVMAQAHQTEALASQEGVQHVQIGVLPDGAGKPSEETELQIQAIVGGANSGDGTHTEVGPSAPGEAVERPTLLTCVVDDPNIVQQLQGVASAQAATEVVNEPIKRDLVEQVELAASELHSTDTPAPQTTDEMQAMMSRTEA